MIEPLPDLTVGIEGDDPLAPSTQRLDQLLPTPTEARDDDVLALAPSPKHVDLGGEQLDERPDPSGSERQWREESRDLQC